MKFKSRSAHDKTKVYQNRLNTWRGFFLGGLWFRKNMNVPKYRPSIFFFLFLTDKHFKNIIINVFHDFLFFEIFNAKK